MIDYLTRGNLDCSEGDALCVQAIEGDMDVMIKYFDELNDLGAQLIQHVDGDEDSTKTVNSQLHSCQDRWDNLVQRMEHCSKQVSVTEAAACEIVRIIRLHDFSEGFRRTLLNSGKSRPDIGNRQLDFEDSTQS